MDYEKKYKEAFERAKIWKYKSGMPKYKQGILDDIFPELKESEEEKIRKEIISALKWANYKGIYDKHIAWLKKQGEQKPQGKSALEAIKEEKVDNQNCVKPTDKVEPKFQNGQWIVWQNQCYKVNYNGCGYELILQNGLTTSLEYGTVDNYAHLWTIEDAKNGDILIYNDSIFIFNEIYENHLIYYGIYEHNKFHNDKYYSYLDLGTIDINNIHPATKEQRNILSMAMADAGYTFDFEKKELKKIEQKTVEWNEEDEQNLNAVLSYINDEHLRRWLKDTIHKKYDKPAEWSEEDMSKVQRICKYLNESKKYYADITEVNECIDWLKSLRPYK